MDYTLAGTPTENLPSVLSTGSTDVGRIFVSMTSREPEGKDADYLKWHSLDHRPEQFRLKGIRHSLRLVSTPECRAIRAFQSADYAGVDHVMTYFFTEDAEFHQFRSLSTALGGDRRPFRLPTVDACYYRLKSKMASPSAIAGADVIPWRPARGVFLILEADATESIDSVVDLKGVAGIWSHQGGEPPIPGYRVNAGLRLSYCFIDEDVIETAARINKHLQQQWARQEVPPLLAAPFHVVVPFEWDRYLP